MSKTKEIARMEPSGSRGLLDWLHRPDWLNALEQVFEEMPLRIEERVDGDVKATYHDGILEIRIPLDHGKAQATKVPVTRV